MSVDLDAAVWPASAMGACVRALAGDRQSRLPSNHDDPSRTFGLTPTVEQVAAGVGLRAVEVEDVGDGQGEQDRAAWVAAPPAIVQIPAKDGWLAVTRGRFGKLRVVGPDGLVVMVAPRALARFVSRSAEDPLLAKLSAAVPSLHRGRATRTLKRLRTDTSLPHGGSSPDPSAPRIWLLSSHPSHGLLATIARAGGLRSMAILLVSQIAIMALAIVAWILLGSGAFSGTLEPGWLVGWACCWLSVVVLRGLASTAAAALSLEASSALKVRLIHGAMALGVAAPDPDGESRAFARVMEAGSVDSLLIAGTLATILAAIQLIVAGAILVLSGLVVLMLAFVVFLVISAVILRRLMKAQQTMAVVRAQTTAGLIERMQGHRTRLVQTDEAHRHVAEDDELARHYAAVEALDRRLLPVWTLDRAWLVAGMMATIPALIEGSASGTSLAVAVGGVLLCQQALESAQGGIQQLTRGLASMRELMPLVRAGAKARPSTPRSALPAQTGHVVETDEPSSEDAVVSARDIVFYHPGHGPAGSPEQATNPVLRGADLEIGRGDRILLEGPSGSGKSTLLSILGARARPQHGLVTVRGLDRATVGDEAWRRAVVVVPQFHQSHVLTQTFAFNALLGRPWPPREEDMERLHELIAKLGLSDLLARMPAGVHQPIGECGWQLSHGERNRLTMLRALMRNDASALVFDESFSALDPESEQRCLDVACEEVGDEIALVVVAHAEQ
ncbi:MAG: ABC transporter ATP-binding protein [Myxococcota bacterium]